MSKGLSIVSRAFLVLCTLFAAQGIDAQDSPSPSPAGDSILVSSGEPSSSVAEESSPSTVDFLEMRKAEIDVILEEALSAADLGKWDVAMAELDRAKTLSPGDPRIESYRTSFLELAALDNAQGEWNQGRPSEVEIPDEDGEESGNGKGRGEGEDGEPKFSIDRGDRDPRESPILTRDLLRADLGLKIFAINPVNSESGTTWSGGDEFFYASLGLDVAYWMPFLRRSLGFNFRSSGYSYQPGNPDIVFNTLDLGINLRGFLLERKTSRMELGVDFGGSMQSRVETGYSQNRSWVFYLGLWISDPVFFHLFSADSLENFLIGGGIRTYSSTADEILETVNYRIEGTFLIGSASVGIRLEWWDFPLEGDRENMMSFSFIGGYRY